MSFFFNEEAESEKQTVEEGVKPRPLVPETVSWLVCARVLLEYLLICSLIEGLLMPTLNHCLFYISSLSF